MTDYWELLYPELWRIKMQQRAHSFFRPNTDCEDVIQTPPVKCPICGWEIH